MLNYVCPSLVILCACVFIFHEQMLLKKHTLLNEQCARVRIAFERKKLHSLVAWRWGEHEGKMKDERQEKKIEREREKDGKHDAWMGMKRFPH